MAVGGKAEALQRLDVDLQRDRLRRADQPEGDRLLEVPLVGMLEVAFVRCELVAPETPVLDVALELVGVYRALAFPGAVGSAESGERADARGAFVVDQVVGVAAGIPGLALLAGEGGQAEPRAEVDQDVLERANVAAAD